jgi:hypothetical protein
MLKFLKWVWVAAVLYVLGETLYTYGNHPDSGIEVLTAVYMLFLTFPVGIVVLLVHVVFSKYLVPIPIGYTTIVLTWIAFVVLGYCQWFVWLPRLQKKYDVLIDDGNMPDQK